MPTYNKPYESGLLYSQSDLYEPVVRRLLDVFRKEKLDCGNAGKVLFLFQKVEIVVPFYFLFPFNQLPFYVDCPANNDLVYSPDPGKVEWGEEILRADYIVDRIGFIPGEGNGAREDIVGQLHSGFSKHKNNFIKIAQIDLPESYSICVYKKIGGRVMDNVQ
jgi:hypothetical protein